MTTTEHSPAEVSHELQHRKQGEERWLFARHLGSDGIVAQLELSRARALAEGNETGVQYRVVQRTERVMGW